MKIEYRYEEDEIVGVVAARTIGSLPRLMRMECTLWYIHRMPSGAKVVRSAPFTCGVNEVEWQPPDYQPTFPRKVVGTPWFATEADAEAYLRTRGK